MPPASRPPWRGSLPRVVDLPAQPRPRRTATPAGIAAAFLVGAGAALGVLGAWKGAARAPTAAMVDQVPAQRRIDINTATADQLALLPRIGPALAQRIVDDRKARGPFRSPRDLERVKGIGPRTFERLEPLIMVNRTELSRPDRSGTAAR